MFTPTPPAAQSHDGAGAGDHDMPYVFGEYPWLRMRLRDHARLMIMRSRIQDTREGFGTRYDGDLASDTPTAA